MRLRFSVALILIALTITQPTDVQAATELPVPFTYAQLCELNDEPSEPKAVHRFHSLCNVWYGGNPLPKLDKLKNFGNLSWRRACEVIDELKQGATRIDRGLFVSAFGGKSDGRNPDYRNALCYFALLDSDADGIRDYRVSLRGRFVENDSDVDNDGVRNLLDPDPFGSNNRNPRTLPTSLRFTCTTNQEPCEIQKALYADFRIALANRDFDESSRLFSEAVKTVDDTVRLVYQDGIRNHPNYDAARNQLPTLQSVLFDYCDTIDETPWRSKPQCGDSVWEVEATAAAHNQSFTVHAVGASRPSFVRLGIFIHELAHSWQFGLDYNTEVNLESLLKKNFWVVPEFESELKDFGWEIHQQRASNIIPQLQERGVLLSASGDIVEHDGTAYKFNDELLSRIKARVGRETLTSKKAQQDGLIGSYAFGGPWEWYADAFMAYVFVRMERHFRAHSSRRQSVKIRTLFRAHVINQWRGEFYHPNLSEKVFNKIAQRLPIADASLDQLVCRYIVNSDYSIFSDPGPYGRHLVARIKKPEDVGEKMKKDWESVCG